MQPIASCPPLPFNESARLAALQSYGILDTPTEGAFDDITRIAALICDAPIAVVNFIDEGRQWFKSEIGLGVRETPLAPSICAHAILQLDLFVVADTTKDDRFRANPLVTGDPGLRFYAGAPLLTPDGLPIGTVCVLDVEPRRLTTQQCDALRALARQTMGQLELRRQLRHADIAAGYRRQLLATISHDLKSPLRAGSYALIRAGRDESVSALVRERLDEATAAFATIDREFNKLLALAIADNDETAPKLAAVVLAEVMNPLLVTWSRAAALKGVGLNHGEFPGTLLSQRELLGTIIGNLLSNAVKYTDDGEIRVSCREQDDNIVLTVADTGRGMDEQHLATLFDAFSQGTTAVEGLGLGMWIVSRTVAMLGHSIAVESVPGAGTTFTLMLRQVPAS